MLVPFLILIHIGRSIAVPTVSAASRLIDTGFNEENSAGQYVYEAAIPLPNYGSLCASQLLVNQSFANSYNHPVTLDYSPPAECGEFTHVTAELHLTINDYQYDRLMHLVKDGVEVWRPSTPEPVGHKVYSELEKDLSRFTNLFKIPGQVEFSLANIVSSQNDGVYQAELVLNFYNDLFSDTGISDTNWFYDSDTPATNFYPVVAKEVQIYEDPASGQVPQLNKNTTRAVLNVFASGNSNEEFWYAGDFSTDGPTRLVEVFVNGELAGAIDPFPVVYTGGISPGLWQPLMGLKSSDVPSYIVDVTPFLPIFWENSETTIEVAVGNGYSKAPQSILSNWIIDASLLTWEISGIEGQGNFNYNNVESYGKPLNNSNGTAESIEASYYRKISNNAGLSFYHSPSGINYTGESLWTQVTSMVNNMNETNYSQSVHQVGEGNSKYTWQPNAIGNQNGSTSANLTLGNAHEYSRSHYYPLELVQTSNNNGSYTLLELDRMFNANVTNNAGSSSEMTSQGSSYQDREWVSETNITAGDFTRQAVAVNDKIVKDTY